MSESHPQAHETQASESLNQTTSHSTSSHALPLSLPPPPPPDTDSDVKKVDATTGESIKFDELGPLVVNSDGTLSRIANWQNMTERERETTMRVLVARNKVRLANQEAQQGTGSSETTAS